MKLQNLNPLNWYRDTPHKDKVKHFVAGAIVASFFGILDPWLGLVLGVFTGVAKEAYDYYDYEKFDFWDLLATSLGALLVCLTQLYF